jgi:hypothetical protein
MHPLRKELRLLALIGVKFLRGRKRPLLRYTITASFHPHRLTTPITLGIAQNRVSLFLVL